MTFQKELEGKIKPSLVPVRAFKEVCRVLLFGDGKYPPENYRNCPDSVIFRDAAERHILEYKCDNVYDSESNLHHLAHAITQLMFNLDMDLRKKDKS